MVPALPTIPSLPAPPPSGPAAFFAPGQNPPAIRTQNAYGQLPWTGSPSGQSPVERMFSGTSASASSGSM